MAGIDEFDRQLGRLTDVLPGPLGLERQALADTLEHLRTAASAFTERPEASVAGAPFLLMPDLTSADLEVLVPQLRLAGSDEPGVLDRNHGPEGLRPYQPLPELGVPAVGPYLVVDVERGEEFCGVRPGEAVATLVQRGRTPLTIAEGLVLQIVRPDLLQKNRCFMLAGSRRGDRRVPALWISGRAPKLGWCWEGNPHSWLGTASAGDRKTAA